MSVCDICSSTTFSEEGFILTTSEVVTSTRYWANQLNKYRNALKYISGREERATYLAEKAGKLSASPTGWLVCSGCMQLFEFDHTKAKKCAAKGIERDDAGPAEPEAFESVLFPAIIEIVDSIRSSDMTISSKRYYQCPQCGAIHFKNESNLQLAQAIDTIPSGGSTCSECGTRSDASHIYSGLLDMDAPDDLIDQMLADPDNVSNDEMTKTWIYKGQVIYGPASKR